MNPSTSKTLKEIILYCIGGGTAFVVTFIVTFVLTEIAHFYYLLSAGTAYIIAFFVNFTFQNRVTFKSERSNTRKLFLFFVVQFLGLLSMLTLLHIFTEWFGVFYLLSLVVASGIVAVLTFSASKFLVFSTKKTVLRQ